MNKLIISLVMSLFLAAPATALAVDETATSGIQNEVKEKQEIKTGGKQEMKDVKENVKMELKERKANTAATLKEQKANTAATLKEQKANTAATLKEQKANTVAELKAAAERKREAFKASVEQKRAEFEKIKEAKITEVKSKAEAARIQLKEKLGKIKDERKKAVVEKINNQIAELNTRQMNHFSNLLDQLDKILVKINERVEIVAVNGRDVTLARTAMENARTAIAAAREAIVVQSGKVYAIGITTEDKLGADVGKTRQLVHTDIVGVREKVKAAREAVHKAAVTLAQIPRVDELGNLPAGGTAAPVNVNESATPTESAVPEANQ